MERTDRKLLHTFTVTSETPFTTRKKQNFWHTPHVYSNEIMNCGLHQRAKFQQHIAMFTKRLTCKITVYILPLFLKQQAKFMKQNKHVSISITRKQMTPVVFDQDTSRLYPQTHFSKSPGIVQHTLNLNSHYVQINTHCSTSARHATKHIFITDNGSSQIDAPYSVPTIYRRRLNIVTSRSKEKQNRGRTIGRWNPETGLFLTHKLKGR